MKLNKYRLWFLISALSSLLFSVLNLIFRFSDTVVQTLLSLELILVIFILVLYLVERRRNF